MLLFGHIGITAAAACASDKLFPDTASYRDSSGVRYRLSSLVDRLRNSSGNIDYRMVIIGSMLPDIIDKPVFLILRDHGFSLSGRDFAHTLLFSLLLLAGGLVLLRYHKAWMMLLALGTLTHLVLDSIWGNPVTLFWPLLGGFRAGETEYWLTDIWNMLISTPDVFIPEVTGLVIVLFLGFRIIRDKDIFKFIRYGTVP
jgi:inner membrane protein